MLNPQQCVKRTPKLELQLLVLQGAQIVLASVVFGISPLTSPHHPARSASWIIN